MDEKRAVFLEARNIEEEAKVIRKQLLGVEIFLSGELFCDSR